MGSSRFIVTMIMCVIAGFYPIYFLILLSSLLIIWINYFKNTIKPPRGFVLNEILPVIFIILIGFLFRIKFSSHIDLDPYGWRYVQDALAINKLFIPFLKNSAGALHVPGYSFLISLPLLFTKNLEIVSVINALFSALTIGIVYLITRFIAKDKLSALLASSMLASSSLHIIYSGFEFPMSFSIFFVSLEFLYLVLWLENKNKSTGWIFILLVLVSINIKIENILYGILFATVFVYAFKKDRDKLCQARDYFKYSLPIFILSCLFMIPFVINQLRIQSLFFDKTEYSLFGIDNFISNIRVLIIQRLHGLPFFSAAGYVLLWLFKKIHHSCRMNLVFVWLLISLLNLFYFIPINAEWNLLQILIPVYIITGYLATWVLNLVLKSNNLKNILLFLLIVLFFSESIQAIKSVKNYSYQDLKRGLNTESDNQDIVSFNLRTSGFALRFLFPRKKWIFINDTTQDNILSDLGDNIYYFNPLPYGLIEEAMVDKLSVDKYENILKKDYNFSLANNKIVLYKLTKIKAK